MFLHHVWLKVAEEDFEATYGSREGLERGLSRLGSYPSFTHAPWQSLPTLSSVCPSRKWEGGLRQEVMIQGSLEFIISCFLQ